MGLRNTPEEYGSVAKFFHWVTFLLITVLLAVGWLMGKADPGIKGSVYNLHKLCGLLVLVITLPRLIWAISGSKPNLPDAMQPWEKVVERVVHTCLYLSLLLMPFFGWAMSTAAGKAPTLFGTQIALPGITQSKAVAHMFNQYHEFFAWVIVVLVTLHAGAALKHHFINKDKVLMTMLPRCKTKN